MEKEQLIALVKKSQSGDPDAIEKLLQYAHTSVSYQCRKMLTNEQDAEDMTQEVLVTIYTKLDTLQEPAAFWKWANQITTSRCINALNRTHVEYQFAEDEDGHSILDNLEELDEQVIPDKAIDNAETARMIEEIVSSLPEVQRAATLMFYYDEMSVKEIAHTMQVSENTVKSRLNYARKAIKEKVLDYEKQGVKLYGLSPLPFLLYFLRLAAKNSADKDAAGVMVAEVMATEGAAAGIAGASAAGAGSATAAAGAGSAAVTAGGSVATTAATTTTATGIFAGISAKVVAGILAAVVTVGSVAAAVIPKTQADTTEPTAVSTEATSAIETESAPETEAPTTEAVTEPSEAETTEPATEATTLPTETESMLETESPITEPGAESTEPETQAPAEQATVPDETVATTEAPTEAPAEETQPVHQHNYKSETTRTPNCTDMGRVKYTCSCGSSYEEDTPALGHDWGEWYESNYGQPEHKCKTCGLVTGEAMDWDDFIGNDSDVSNDNSGDCPSCGIGNITLVLLTEPTCEYRGETAGQCNHCGYIAGYNYTPANGHNIADGVCTVCGATETTCNHVYDGGVPNYPAGPNDFDPYILYTCTLCGHTYQEPTEMP